MRRAALTCLLLALAAAPARAEIRVIDTATGASRTLAHEDPRFPWTVADPSRVLRFTDDGGALLVRPRGAVLQIGVRDGSVRALPQLEGAQSVGPGGRWIEVGADRQGRPRVLLRGGDGRRIGRYGFGRSFSVPFVAWSADGNRVAVAIAPRLYVLDTSTGAVVLRRRTSLDVELTAQAFAPGGDALVLTDRVRVLRIALPSGAATTLLRAALDDRPSAAWGATGRIAVSTGDAVTVFGDPPLGVQTDARRSGPAFWNRGGSELDYAFGGPQDDCRFPSQGLAAVVPGQAPRVVLPPLDRALIGWTWAPDGTTLAIDVAPGESAGRPARRGRRHAWPKHVPLDFGLFSAEANRAARRVVLRAANALRAGAGREETLHDVRLGMEEVARFDGGDDSAVLEAVADALDPWIHAAGYERIEALDEVLCI